MLWGRNPFVDGKTKPDIGEGNIEQRCFSHGHKERGMGERETQRESWGPMKLPRGMCAAV